MPMPHIPGWAKHVLIYMMVKENSAVMTSFCLVTKGGRQLRKQTARTHGIPVALANHFPEISPSS